MRASEETLRILEQALGIAGEGVDGAEVSVGGGVMGLTRFADNTVHQSVSIDREVMSIRVLANGRVGRAETSDYTPPGIQAAARQARMLAELLPDGDEQASFSEPQDYRVVEAHDQQTERVKPLDRMSIVGRTIVHAHRDQLRASGYMATCHGAISPESGIDGIYAVANTRGLAAYHAATRADFSVTMLDRREMSGWAHGRSYAYGALDTEVIAEIAAQKAEVPGLVEDIEPGEHTVILEPAAVASLLEFLARTCGADDAAGGNSFLSGRIGETIAGDNVSIYDDFSHDLQRGAPFDVEGVAKKRVVLIDAGVAQGPVYGRASALRADVAPTGHKAINDVYGETEAASNLCMLGGTDELEDLVGTTKSGLLVSRLWYTRMVDTRDLVLTGVTRDGTFLIKDGEIIAPVRNMRFQVSLLDLLSAIDGMTAVSPASGMVVPAIRVNGFTLTSSVAS